MPLNLKIIYFLGSMLIALNLKSLSASENSSQAQENQVSLNVRLYGWVPSIQTSASTDSESNLRKKEVLYFYKLGDRFKEITIKLGVTTASFYYEGPEKFVIYQKQLDETFNPVASVVMKQESKEVFMVVVFIPGAKRDKQLNCIPFNQNILKAGNMIFLNLASKQVAFRLGQEYAELDSQQKTTLEVEKMDHPGSILKALILEKGKLTVFRSIFLKKPKEENATLVIFYPYVTNGGSKNKKTKHSFHVIPVKF
jgi:hypothetical protein